MVGAMPSDENKFLCVVGAREHSQYGQDACNKLIGGLKGYPIVIVSGLAIGIDSLAHEAALINDLKTVAFPGSGLSRGVLAPSSRIDLAERIVKSGGALLSPFDKWQRGDYWTFPARNRLMAGMSHATLIVEARRGSGTLLTAEYAAQFNRDILAIPGSIFSDLSYGPHMLIDRGATPITSSRDILDALGFPRLSSQENGQQSLGLKDEQLVKLSEVSLSPQEKQIVDRLRAESLTANDLIEKISIPSPLLSVLISELELRGVIVEKEGRYKLA